MSYCTIRKMETLPTYAARIWDKDPPFVQMYSFIYNLKSLFANVSLFCKQRASLFLIVNNFQHRDLLGALEALVTVCGQVDLMVLLGTPDRTCCCSLKLSVAEINLRPSSWVAASLLWSKPIQATDHLCGINPLLSKGFGSMVSQQWTMASLAWKLWTHSMCQPAELSHHLSK